MNSTEKRSARLVMVSLGVLAVILGGLWLFGRERGGQTAYRQALRSLELTQQMGDALHAAAQSERQAVMAEGDEDSRRHAQDARNATERVGGLLAELKQAAAGGQLEPEAVARFEKAFADYLRVDEEVLGLAVQNTNLKAFALSFGQARDELRGLEAALKPALGGADAKRALLAQRALAEALRIQSLHAPHVMEKGDGGMDVLERDMAAADRAARAALAGLEPAAGAARQAYERYWGLNAEIVALSRRNTNLRSLDLSLERKTRVLAACDAALRQLEDGIRERMASRATR